MSIEGFLRFNFYFQLMTLKLELDSRPTQEDFDAKIQQGNILRSELTNLTEQMTSNEKLLEEMQTKLTVYAEMMQKSLVEREVQTELQDSTKEVPVVKEAALENTTVASAVLTESPLAVEEVQSKTTMPQVPSAMTSTSTSCDNDDDDALNNHPKVLYEDELIVFKEKCTNLTAENVRLHREIGEIRANMSQYHKSWLHNFMLKYLVPVLIVFVAYTFYSLK